MAAAGNSTPGMSESSAAGGMRIPNDAELLREIARANQAAFRALVDGHAGYLYRVAHSLTGSGADADDLVQETFAAVLESQFRGESSVRTWLVAILVRRAAMLRRTAGRRIRASSLDDAASASTKSGADATEARLDVNQMLQELSEEHRQVIVLRELQGMSYDDIAAALEVPRGTVESRLFRAREELRKRFKGYGS